MKNFWMSAWLSAANKEAGTARGHWMAEARRQQKAMAKEAGRAFGVPAATSKRKSGKPKRKG